MPKALSSFTTLLVLSSTLLISCTTTSPENETFIKFFGGAFNQKAEAFELSPTEDFFIITGSSRSFGVSPINTQVFVIKTDLSGNRIQQNAFGTEFLNQEGKGIAFTQNGDVLILAHTDSLGGNQPARLTLLRLNADLDSLEQRFYDIAVDEEEKLYISPTDDGGFVLLGTSPEPSSSSQKDMILAKIDASLTLLYTRRYGLLDKDDIAGSVLIEGESITWCGTSNRQPSDSDMRILRADASGELVWTFDFEENNNLLETGRDIQKNNDLYAIVGSRASNGSGDAIFVVEMNVNTQGIIQNTSTAAITLGNDNINPVGRSILPLDASLGGGYLVAGSLENNGNPGAFLLKLDANLQPDSSWPINPQVFGGDSDSNTSERTCEEDRGEIVRASPDGGFFLLSTICFETNSVISLIKTDAQGNVF